MNRSGSSVKESVCVLRKRSLSGRNWRLNARGFAWKENDVNENVRNCRISGVLRPCALRSSSVHVSGPMMGLGVVRMIIGMVTTRELTMMGQGEELEEVVVMTTVETEVVLMIVLDNRATITGSNGQREEIVLIAAVGTVMHHQQREVVMEDLPVGPAEEEEDPDLHEMTIEEEEEHQHQDLMPDLQLTDLTAVEVLVVMTVLVVALTVVHPLPGVVEPPPQDQAGLEEMHQYHHAKIDTREEEGQELHQAEIVGVGIIVDHGVVVADRMMG